MKRILVLLLATLLVTPFFNISEYVRAAVEEPAEQAVIQASDVVQGQYIVKWKNGAEVPERFWEQVEVLHRDDEHRTMLVRWVAAQEAEATVAGVMEAWAAEAWVEYVQPNFRYKMKALPNDPEVAKQGYFSQIQAETAWDRMTGAKDVIVALVDTGVDVEHPDLKGNLLPGKNLLNTSKPPLDDNGHGTNVAGILGAVGNNKVGVSGVLWSAKLLPVKVLDENGDGDDYIVGQGIRYAVDYGAKVVVLALGMPYFGPHMEEVVRYAESKGVVVIAATGNEGDRVKYPAAYPTVLAVGAVDKSNEYLFYSNYGSEIDVVAPGEGIYTTFKGGGYDYNSGTSMAAPQVAALAAMLIAQNPAMKPSEVRNLIRYTAKDVGKAGWDQYTGFGVIQMEKALTTLPVPDIYEPNNKIQTAKQIQINSGVDAELTEAADVDTFFVDSEYAGAFSIAVKLDRQLAEGLEVSIYQPNSTEPARHILKQSKTVKWNVQKGRSIIQIKRTSEETDVNALKYSILVNFKIYQDAFEDNDDRFKAYVLAARSQTLTGTFHKDKDIDWFMMNVPQDGTLKLKVSVNSKRIDPVLSIQQTIDSEPLVIDSKGPGKEETLSFTVLPGKYYFRISDYNERAEMGEYVFDVQYLSAFKDGNEPNNGSTNATLLQPFQESRGTFDKGDVDWFKWTIPGDSIVTLKVGDIPSTAQLRGILMNSKQTVLGNYLVKPNQVFRTEVRLGKGTYYFKLTSSEPFQKQQYFLIHEVENLISGYRDIERHWAQKDIVKMTTKGFVKGYEDYTFRPHRPITRAEVAGMLVRMKGLTQQGEIPFADVPADHWAHTSIARAYTAGWIVGYDDGKFRPDDPITRAEMAALVARAYQMSRPSGDAMRFFRDVPEDHWAMNSIQRLATKGWILGYGDYTFRPGLNASRADFVTLISRIVN